MMNLEYQVFNHPKEMLLILNELRISGSLCDISLKAESKIFRAHKVILSAASPYFKAMFSCGMKECCMEEVPLQGVQAYLLNIIVDFIYTSELILNESNVSSLLALATMFQMPSVIDACAQFIERQLEPANCIGLADFAQMHGCFHLYKHAQQFIYKYFSEVSKCEEFLELSHSQVIQIIKRDELNVIKESEVFEALIRWVLHEEEKRRLRLPQLLLAIRCHALTPKYIMNTIENCVLFNNCLPAKEYLLNVLSKLKSHEYFGNEICSKRIQPQSIYIIGGYLRQSLSFVDAWMPDSNEWLRLESLSQPRSGIAACEVDGCIYIIGGRNTCKDTDFDSSRVEKFDPRTNIWYQLESMLSSRNRAGAAALDGMVYAVGGSNGIDHHKSVERYDPELKMWSYVKEMSTARVGVGVAVVGRYLFAVGGYDGKTRLGSVEFYNPDEDIWQISSPMSVARSGAGVCSLGNCIYVAGGYDGTNQISLVEKFDLVTKEWQSICQMGTPRSALNLAVFNKRIYAIGGYDGSTFLANIEYYDEESKHWSVSTSMQCARSGHGVTVGIRPNIEYFDKESKRWNISTGKQCEHNGQSVTVGIRPHIEFTINEKS